MQRLHENDIAAHLLEREDWTVLALPERFWPTHPYAWRGQPQGPGGEQGLDDRRAAIRAARIRRLLWPEQRPEAISDAQAASLRYRATGQLQQWPRRARGSSSSATSGASTTPTILTSEKRKPRFRTVVQSIDTPLKDKESNDLVAIQAWGVGAPTATCSTSARGT